MSNNKIMSNNLAIFYLIMSQSMVAVNIVSAKYLLATIPAILLLTMRFSFGALLSLPLHWLMPQKKQSIQQCLSVLTYKDWSFIVAQALMAGCVFNCFMLIGLRETDANVAGIITSTMPAIIALMSWKFLKEKISLKTTACILLASIGLMIVASDKLRGGATINHSIRGDLLILISMIPEATYYILVKIHPNNLPIFLTSSLLNGINALVLLCFLPFMHFSDYTIQMEDWSIIFFISMSSVLFYVFWFLGAQRVNNIVASLSTTAMPIITVIMAWLFLGEQLSLIQATGMIFVLLSILVYAKK